MSEPLSLLGGNNSSRSSFPGSFHRGGRCRLQICCHLCVQDFMFISTHLSVPLGESVPDGPRRPYKCPQCCRHGSAPSSVNSSLFDHCCHPHGAETFHCLFLFTLLLPLHEVTIPLFLFHFFYTFSCFSLPHLPPPLILFFQFS